jgi:hypothetical protein
MTPAIIPNQSTDVEAYFKAAWAFTTTHHAAELEWLSARDKKSCEVPEDFFEQYVWCVYVSGFNAAIVAAKWPQLTKAWMGFNPYMCEKNQYLEADKVISNSKKNLEITKISQEIRACGSKFVDRFTRKYLDDRYKMQRLPFMGETTSYHLARNLGFDYVKPDLHLTRLMKLFNFGSAEVMCQHVNNRTGCPIPLVDFAMFCYASHKFVKKKGCCGLSLLRLR